MNTPTPFHSQYTGTLPNDTPKIFFRVEDYRGHYIASFANRKDALVYAGKIGEACVVKMKLVS